MREWNASTGDLVQEVQIAPLYAAAWSPYTGRLAVLQPNAEDARRLRNGQEFDANTVTGTLSIIVPMPSLEQLQSIANTCHAPEAVGQSLTGSNQADQLTDFVAQIEALPEDSIPPACRADLLAVAEALQLLR